MGGGCAACFLLASIERGTCHHDTSLCCCRWPDKPLIDYSMKKLFAFLRERPGGPFLPLATDPVRSFVPVVQMELHLRVASDVWNNLRMRFLPSNYSLLSHCHSGWPEITEPPIVGGIGGGEESQMR